MRIRQAGKILAVLALVLGLAVLSSAQTRILTILHANDTHSAMLPIAHQPYPTPFTWLWPDHKPGWVNEFKGPWGFNRDYAGIARMATLIKKIRMSKGNVLALHAGDVFVGSFEFNTYLGYPEMKIMEGLYDAMSLGNHEFDLKMDTLAGVVSGVLAQSDMVTLPLLCANINFTGHALENLIRKQTVLTIDGTKVGIFGLVNEDPFNYQQEVVLRFSNDLRGVAQAQADDLRGQGCQVVICLSHLGTSDDLGLLADQVSGIDVIVGGHSHDSFDRAVVRNGKIVVQAGSHGRSLGELQLSVDAGGVKLLKWKLHRVDGSIKPDPAVQGRLAALRAGVEAKFGPVYTEPVAMAFRNVGKDWPAVGPFRDTPLGNLVTDAMKSAATAWTQARGVAYTIDCALDALGYTEFGIPAGKVVGNDIQRAIPYGYDSETGLGFKLVVVPLPGQIILGALDYAISQGSGSLVIQGSGLTYAYHSGIGHIVPESVMINGEPVAANLDKTYYLVMTNGIFGFLENLAASMGLSLSALDIGIHEYTAVRDFMDALNFVYYKSEGRVMDLAAAAATTPARRRELATGGGRRLHRPRGLPDLTGRRGLAYTSPRSSPSVHGQDPDRR